MLEQNLSFKSIEDLEEATIAISRFGSGSHLMAIVNAYNQGWDVEKLKFKVIGNLQGGIDALQMMKQIILCGNILPQNL